MVRFAIKSLVVLVLIGHAIKLAEPAESAPDGDVRFIPASYSEEPVAPVEQQEIASHLSAFTNAQIVVSHTASDAAGFCDRQPLACQSGRELLVRVATSVRDVAGSFVSRMDGEEEVQARSDPDTEYRPLDGYRGSYPLLPAEPPARSGAF
ncbi:hypothetical protein Plav_0063 [Parvibaculum lavamentivorans DS-1]|uniref:Uncharacterized protein n=1 Tax=Parvibaculum lavamentivorans (strain DS-1 / DSM 13023 / NCIMB 13966) TaxID=402881 RepID=A7HP53_PARL1|nr:DUF5330 domain-containing protein [Parvibaculum lavamentivorans]ABS61686.1 hypothetical protein Plav_0063 [Parvibaculum lavamentivorans DS-1]